VDATEVDYQISTPYNPEAARGVRWDDPFHGVTWPAPVEVIAARDRGYPDLDSERLQELCGL
jgi:dTDP-4-dehydrorhamnose 3,5-epimerase